MVTSYDKKCPVNGPDSPPRKKNEYYLGFEKLQRLKSDEHLDGKRLTENT